MKTRRWMRLAILLASMTPALVVLNCGGIQGNSAVEAQTPPRQTAVAIAGDSFLINGHPIYAGRTFNGMKVQGLLMNSRMVQGVFDDLNPATVGRWNYPNGPWDPNRNTSEFIAAMPAWRKAGLISFTINLQGGCPYGYCQNIQPWDNSAFLPDGTPRAAYLSRLQQILNRADQLGMVPILGLFYFGQENRLRDERAVIHAVESITDWLTIDRGYRNVVIEIANECDNKAYHPILQPARVAELIQLVQRRSYGKVKSRANRLLVSVSLSGMKRPPDDVIGVSDFILLHGNGAKSSADLTALIDSVRAAQTFRGQPIVVNEDDHYNFDQPDNDMIAALGRRAGWGFFDYRRQGEGFAAGYQGVPTDWTIDSPRKIAFFNYLTKVTGG